MLIDVPVLVVGGGPAALVAAKLVGGWGLSTLLVGHVPIVGSGEQDPVVLEPDVVEVLDPPGILKILRPYLCASDPATIATADFEDVVKHHCVVDMNVTVYDGMELIDCQPQAGGCIGVLTDGRSRWDVHADALIDTSGLSLDLNEAVRGGGAAANAVLAARRAPLVRD